MIPVLDNAQRNVTFAISTQITAFMRAFCSPNLNIVFVHFSACTIDALVWRNITMKEKWTRFLVLNAPIDGVQLRVVNGMLKSSI